MIPGIRRSVQIVLWIAAMLYAGSLLPAGPRPSPLYAQAASGSNTGPAARPNGKLSARLARLIQPAVQAQDAATRAQAVSLPEHGAGSLLTNEQGELLVAIRLADTTDATLTALKQAGASIVHVAAAYNIATAYVRPEDVNAIASLEPVENMREELRPFVGSFDRQPQAPPPAAGNAQVDCAAVVRSEGDAQLKADRARSQFNLDGTGVTIGVLSDSYNKNRAAATTAISDTASGNLPGPGNPCGHVTPPNVLAEAQSTDATDEGRAMMQIIHDLAPGANLAFATASEGLFQFADNIRALRSRAHADIIVDDVVYLVEPFFQDGPASVAIQDVTAQGALYFAAAGNSHAVAANNKVVSSYEAAAYRPLPCPTLRGTSLPPGTDCHNFNPAAKDPTMSFTLAPGGGFLLIFQWAEPWFGVTTDLDIYLTNQAGQILAGSEDTNPGRSGTQVPFETFAYQNRTGTTETVQLVIARSAGKGTPRLKYILARSGNIAAAEYPAANTGDTFGPTVFGHSGSASAISVAAVPFDNATKPEDFSSRGFQTLYYGPVGNFTGTGPAPAPAKALAAPEIRRKPDVAATDGARNTFFGDQVNGVFRFFGTSAAAPHAAGVAALLKQRANQRGILLQQGMTEAILETTAAPIAKGSPEASGAGLVDAFRAVYGVEGVRLTHLPLIQRN